MATKKKKSKKAKARVKAKKPAVKKTKKLKKAPKKKVVKKAKKKSVARKPAAKKKPAAKPAVMAPVALPGERVGIVTHYYNHLSVAIIQIETGVLRIGDVVHIKGHTSDFRQPVESMEVDHVHVAEARPGQSFGLRVKDHAREHDVVYKVKP